MAIEVGIVLHESVTNSMKTGLICTPNYTHSMHYNFSSGLVNNTKFTSFYVPICLVSLVSDLHTYSLAME